MKSQITHHKVRLLENVIDYLLKRSIRSRYVRLTIHSRHGLVISAPMRYPEHQIEEFIRQKEDWIVSKLKILKQNLGSKFVFDAGEKLTLLGQDYELTIQKTNDLRPSISLEFPKAVVSVPLGNINQAKQFFIKWMERFTKQTVEGRVEFFAQKYNLKYSRIVIKNQQSVWGSCSTKKNLNFSKRLIQTPLWLLDYVVCHELAHLTQMNHSQKFWILVGEYYPDYRRARRYLKAYVPNVKLE